MGNNLPDFSTMTAAQLFAWAWKYKHAGRGLAAEILPGRPRGYVAIVRDMAEVAYHRGVAKRAKEERNEHKALAEWEEAERLRAELPDFARPS